MNRFIHFFKHDWSKWKYSISYNHWTLLGTLDCVTFRERKCLYCGKVENEFYGYGDKT
jgi:hypothetical protein